MVMVIMVSHGYMQRLLINLFLLQIAYSAGVYSVSVICRTTSVIRYIAKFGREKGVHGVDNDHTR